VTRAFKTAFEERPHRRERYGDDANPRFGDRPDSNADAALEEVTIVRQAANVGQSYN